MRWLQKQDDDEDVLNGCW